jgi:hypothetical protein
MIANQCAQPFLQYLDQFQHIRMPSLILIFQYISML